MKKTVKNIKIKAKTLKMVAATSVGTVACAPLMAFAADEKTTTAHDMVGTLLGYVLGIFFWIGLLFLAWGIAQLVLAFKNEDADSKSRAMMVLLSGLLLTIVDQILKGVVGTTAGDVNINKNTNF